MSGPCRKTSAKQTRTKRGRGNDEEKWPHADTHAHTRTHTHTQKKTPPRRKQVKTRRSMIIRHVRRRNLFAAAALHSMRPRRISDLAKTSSLPRPLEPKTIHRFVVCCMGSCFVCVCVCDGFGVAQSFCRCDCTEFSVCVKPRKKTVDLVVCG